MANEIKIGVVGSPQSGKTALIGALREHTEAAGMPFVFTEVHNPDDLHGHAFDMVLQVVDSTNLETSLLLTPHIIDEQEKIIMAFGRYDALLETDHELDFEKMHRLIGVPQCRVSVRQNKGIDELLQLLQATNEKPVSTAHPIYHIRDLGNEEAYAAYVHGVLNQTLRHAKNDQQQTRLERIDKVLTNKWIGFPIMLLILYLVFECTFTLGAYPQEWIADGIDALCEWSRGVMGEGWFSSLLIDGIIQGVGAVLAFLPNIIILFFFISIMEDTGYMSREAYLMDGIMHHVGLHGRSFVPMLMGFGCNVPAIMAARDLKDPKDRALTMLMVPFMSCSARLPVYMLFVDTFFTKHKALVMLSLYALGVCIGILFALIMKRTRWFKKPDEDLVNELPEFRMPSWRNTGLHIWERVADYLQKIATVILWASIIIWALEYFPSHSAGDVESSYLAMIGQALSPVMEPLGFDWRMAVCLLTGLPAKEAIVSTLAILYGGDISLGFTPLKAYAFMVFVLLYFPCVATIVTLRREVGRGWAWYMVVQSLLLAWLGAFAIYQGGLLLGL